MITSKTLTVEESLEQLNRLILIERPHHKKWLLLSMSCLPFSIAFSIVPGPNIPLGYNLFRIYSHWRAVKGCEALDLFRTNKLLSFAQDEQVDKLTLESIEKENHSNSLFDVEQSKSIARVFTYEAHLVRNKV